MEKADTSVSKLPSSCLGCGVVISISNTNFCDACNLCVNEDYDLDLKPTEIEYLSENEDDDDWLFDDGEFIPIHESPSKTQNNTISTNSLNSSNSNFNNSNNLNNFTNSNSYTANNSNSNKYTNANNKTNHNNSNNYSTSSNYNNNLNNNLSSNNTNSNSYTNNSNNNNSNNANNSNRSNNSNHSNNSFTNNSNSSNSSNNLSNSNNSNNSTSIINSNNGANSFQATITSFFSNVSQKSKNTLDSWLGIKPTPSPAPSTTPPKKTLSGTKRSPKSSGSGAKNGKKLKSNTKNGNSEEWEEEKEEIRQKTEEPAQRKPPFYKRVENSDFFVDPFRFDCRIGCERPKYFLSHFHSDHYGGITNKWDRGPIICSEVTGSLLRTRLRVHRDFIRPVPLNSPFFIDNTKITLLDANHCPGACMFLFEFPNGQKALHVGDCRYCTEMRQYKELQNVKIDLLYLDTTYCNPAYTFPTQNTVINHAAEIVANHLSKTTLFVVGTYTIGKERIIVQLASVFGFKVYAQPWKVSILKQLQLPAEFISSLTPNPEEAQLHITPIWQLSLDKLIKSVGNKYTSIIAFKPTGWTHQSGGLSTCVKKANVSIYGVPYSEHSSFTELREFVDFLKPRKIIPTVNNSNGNKVKEMVALLTSNH